MVARSRRSFLRLSGAGLAAGPAALLGGCGNDEAPEPASLGPSEATKADLEVLGTALELELASVVAYSAAVQALQGGALALGRRFLAIEREHAERLTAAIRELGGTPPARREPDPSFPRDALQLAVELEQREIATYLDLLPKLSDPGLRGTVAAILTTEAGQLAALRAHQGEEPLAGAFVVGAA